MATMVPLSEEPPRRAGCSSCSNPVADALGRAWHALQHSALLGNMSDDTGDVSQHGEAKRLKGKDLWVAMHPENNRRPSYSVGDPTTPHGAEAEIMHSHEEEMAARLHQQLLAQTAASTANLVALSAAAQSANAKP